MALVDGPTGENDNMICVAYKHQFDLINESTGDAYRLHHVDANRVRPPTNIVYVVIYLPFIFSVPGWLTENRAQQWTSYSLGETS